MDATAGRAVKGAGYEYACAVETPLAEIGIMALPRVYVGQRDGPPPDDHQAAALPGLQSS